MRRLTVVALAMSTLFVAPQAVALGAQPEAKVTVIGKGKVMVRPDVIRLNIGVEARRPKATAAYAAAAAAARRLIDALRDAGIKKDDIRTSEVTLQTEFVPDKHPEVAGYRAAYGVEAVVRDLKRAGAVIDKVVAVGEEARLNGMAFEVDDDSQALRRARKEAFSDAKAKAAQYAELAGRELGEVISVKEQVDKPPMPIPFGVAAAEAISSDLPVEPGRQPVTVDIEVVYELR